MFLMDVNVLVYAHREDTLEHSAYREWLESTIYDTVPYGYSELVLSGFFRIVTHPRIFEAPSALSSAVRFANHKQNGVRSRTKKMGGCCIARMLNS